MLGRMRHIPTSSCWKSALAALLWQPSSVITIDVVHFRTMPSQQPKVTVHLDLYESQRHLAEGCFGWDFLLEDSLEEVTRRVSGNVTAKNGPRASTGTHYVNRASERLGAELNGSQTFCSSSQWRSALFRQTLTCTAVYSTFVCILRQHGVNDGGECKGERDRRTLLEKLGESAMPVRL